MIPTAWPCSAPQKRVNGLPMAWQAFGRLLLYAMPDIVAAKAHKDRDSRSP